MEVGTGTGTGDRLGLNHFGCLASDGHVRVKLHKSVNLSIYKDSTISHHRVSRQVCLAEFVDNSTGNINWQHGAHVASNPLERRGMEISVRR